MLLTVSQGEYINFYFKNGLSNAILTLLRHYLDERARKSGRGLVFDPTSGNLTPPSACLPIRQPTRHYFLLVLLLFAYIKDQ